MLMIVTRCRASCAVCPDVVHECVCQGQSRRVQVEVRSVQDSGTMPLITESVINVSIGNVEVHQTRPGRSTETQTVKTSLLSSLRHWILFTKSGCEMFSHVYLDSLTSHLNRFNVLNQLKPDVHYNSR